MKRTWGVLAIAVVALGLAACTGEPDRGGVPSAGGGPSTSAPPADPAAQERAFVVCMRREGIADMPDPVPGDTSGRSAVRYALDVMGKGLDGAFQDALEKCRSLLPTVSQPTPSTGDIDAYRQFSKCMRDNGITEFPDPDPNHPGGPWFVFSMPNATGEAAAGPRVSITDGVVVVNMGDSAVGAAYDKCKSSFPRSG